LKELDILKETFSFSIKDSEADHRHRILRVVKSLVTRVKELVRIAARDNKKTFVDVSNNALTSCEDLSRSIYTWLGDVCLSNCFPGRLYLYAPICKVISYTFLLCRRLIRQGGNDS
jgi:hypothetical protein